MRIRMRDLLNDDVLAGALTGRRSLSLLLDRVEGKPPEPYLVYLDFEGIEVATASFLRESVLEFRDIVRRRWPNCYPVIANASASVTEELSILALVQRDVFVLCSLKDDGTPGSSRLVGNLDPKQKVTFDLVKELGETDAGDLMRRSPKSEDIRQTAWNNRLASLNKLGLLMEISHGRAKRYCPLPLEG